MGIFGKLFKGPEIDQAKSADSKQKMRRLFDSVVPGWGAVPAGGRLYGGREAVQLRSGPRQQDHLRQPDRGLEGGGGPHGGGSPTVPDLSGCGDPEICPRSTVKKAYRNKYPTDAFIIYPDGKHYLAINTFEWLEDEKLFIYVDQGPEQQAFETFFQTCYATK